MNVFAKLGKITKKQGTFFPLRCLSRLPWASSLEEEGAARARLESVYPWKRSSAVAEVPNRIDARHDLQIVIPVYNGEEHIEECLDSVFAQKTRFSFVVVIVDDGSTDGTAKKLEKYAKNKNVVILHQYNQGLSGGRNTGFREILGKYLMFVDGDDRLPEDAVEVLLSAAYAADADIVEGNHVKFDRSGFLKTTSRFRAGYAWKKVYRAEIFERIVFPAGFWFEDTFENFVVFDFAPKYVEVGNVVYHYRLNKEGLSFQYKGKPKVMDSLWITLQLLDDRERLGLGNGEDFLPVLLRQISMNCKRISSLGRPDIDKALFSVARAMLGRMDAGTVAKAALPAKEAFLLEALERGNYPLYLASSFAF